MNTTNASPMITSRNETWGFYGTLGHNGIEGAAALFEEAAIELMRGFGLTKDEARDLLDSRIGRHMASELVAGERGADLVRRLCSHRTWARDILQAARELEGAAAMVSLLVRPGEIPVLRFALDHALSSISEAHSEDRAKLQALIERLEAAEKAARS